MESATLEQIIKQYVNLPPSPSGTGWYPVLHTQCDHGRKGARAGFRFDGDSVAFHCFNCGHKAVFDPNDPDPDKPVMSKNMIQVMDDFGVPEDEWKQVMLSVLAQKDKGLTLKTKDEVKITNIEPDEIEFPDNFYPLSEASDVDKWAMVATHYLEGRNIDPSSYPFMLATKSTDDPRLNKWLGRVIIPMYKDNKLIFYHGRDLTGKKTKKYESPSISRDKVIYGFDQLFTNYDDPLYIVEGFFDAYVIDGVGLIGNEISKSKIAWLNRSRRKKVYVPDQFGDGIIGAKTALEQGWYISTPDIGDIKDISAAVQKYGRMYVMKTLAENTAIGFEAETKLGVFCK